MNSSHVSTPVAEIAATGPKAPNTKRIVVRKDKTNPRRIAYLLLFLFASPGNIPLLVCGATLAALAIFLHAWAAGYLTRAGYVERVEKVLTVGGPYRHNRNPYYLAHLNMDFGFFCMAGLPWLYLFYFPISFVVYRTWVKKEEPFLEEEFGDKYITLKKEVPRWGWRLTPAPSFKDGSERFSWKTFKINKELSRAVPHLIILLTFLVYHSIGNPFANVDALVKITWVCVILVWLLLHDIFLDDLVQPQKSPPWIILSISIALGLTFFVSTGELWKPWSNYSVWGAVPVALFLGLNVIVRTFSKSRAGKSKSSNARPILQWYMLGLAFGILSLRLGGVWICFGILLIMWALELGGVLQVKPFPRNKYLGIALIVLIVSAAAVSIVTYEYGTKLFCPSLVSIRK